jgi:hypothetical protein
MQCHVLCRESNVLAFEDWEACARPRAKRQRRRKAGPGDGASLPDEHMITEAIADLFDSACVREIAEAIDLLDDDGSDDDGPEEDDDKEDVDEPEETGDAEEEHAAPEEIEVTPANCIETLWRLRLSKEVVAKLPNFFDAPSWEVKKMDEKPPRSLSKTRCIQGTSLRTDCKVHAKCKLHIDVRGDLFGADAASHRWGIAGCAMTRDEHMAAAKRVVELFKTLMREGKE